MPCIVCDQTSTDQVEHSVSILNEALDLVEVLMSPDDSIDSELRLQYLRLVRIANQHSDVKSVGTRVLQETGEH